MIWTLSTLNASQMSYNLGSGSVVLNTTKTFDSFGSLSGINTVNTANNQLLQNLVYSINPANGVLNSRTDNLVSNTETFTYDPLYRLTNSSINGVPSSALVYNPNLTGNLDPNTNIYSKTNIGTYAYKSSKLPHQVLNVTPPTTTGISDLSPIPQNINYDNNNNKVSSIIDNQSLSNQLELDFIYGSDNERVKTDMKGTESYTKYFFGLYEKIIMNSNTMEYYYIPGGDGMAAVLIKTNGNSGTLYYILKDHLGSFVALVDVNGNVQEQYNYDPWGRRRNITDWS